MVPESAAAAAKAARWERNLSTLTFVHVHALQPRPLRRAVSYILQDQPHQLPMTSESEHWLEPSCNDPGMEEPQAKGDGLDLWTPEMVMECVTECTPPFCSECSQRHHVRDKHALSGRPIGTLDTYRPCPCFSRAPPTFFASSPSA